MKNIIVIGETMIEYSGAGDNLWKQSFGGDVHSLAFYLKCCAPEETHVNLMSSVGLDTISNDLIRSLNQDSIGTQLIYRHPTKQMGLYMIVNDDNGEREFIYWRNESAAREMMNLHKEHFSPNSFAAPDQIFFSGITLAIIDESSRNEFWRFIDWAKSQGTKIIFDPNHRPKLWASNDACKTQYQLAFKASDIILPGVDDFRDLYNLNTPEEIACFLKQFEIEEIIIKNGSSSILYCTKGVECSIPIKPVSNVIDTTAAGDSFNGSYLAARLKNLDPIAAIRFASHISALVIQHKGALVNKDLFNKYLSTPPQI